MMVVIDRLCRPPFFALLLLSACVALSVGYADHLVPAPDESAALCAAAKITRGLVFYRDIDAYPFPGSSYLLALSMSIFGEHLSVARTLAGGSFCVLVLSLYAIALKLMVPRRAALFSLLLLSFKFLAFPNFTAYLYSDLALTVLVLAMAILLYGNGEGSRWRFAAAGTCVGLAVLLKQNTGIYVGAAFGLLALLRIGRPAVPLVRGRGLAWGDAAFLAGGFALGFVPALVYFASEGLLPQMLYSGLVRPFTGYLGTSGVGFSPQLAWWEFGSLQENDLKPYFPLLYIEMIYGDLLTGHPKIWWLLGEFLSRALYTSIPITFGLAALLIWKSKGDAPRGALLPVSLFALAILASAFPRADYAHIINVYPVVLLLLFALTDGVATSSLWMKAEASGVALFAAACTGLALYHDSTLTERIEMERASLWVRPKHAWIESVVNYVEEEVPVDEPIFVYGHEAQFYFLTGRYFPWPFVQLYPGMEGGDDGRRLAALVARSQPRLMLQGVISWPGVPTLTDYTRVLQETLLRMYEPDPDLFERHPSRGEPPPGWVITAHRLREPQIGRGGPRAMPSH